MSETTSASTPGGESLHPEVGIQIVLQGSAVEAVRVAQKAEALGLDSVWVTDHVSSMWGDDDGALDCWATLGALACSTSSVQLGTLVCCAVLRPPAVIANAARTVHGLSNGRLILGLGSGWSPADYAAAGRPFDGAAERIAEFGRVVSEVRSHLDASKVSIPLLIAADSARSIGVAAEYASLWVGSGPPPAWRERRCHLDRLVSELERQEVQSLINLPSVNDARFVPTYLRHGVRRFVLMCADERSVEDAASLRATLM